MLHLPIIIFRDQKGKILLQFRDSQAPSAPLAFSFFGGVTEGDETPLEGMIREVEEELNMNIAADDLRLLAEEPWTGENSEKEKIVYFYEYRNPISWNDIDVREGAGAAFLTKDEIASMDNVTKLVKHFVGKHVH